MQHIEKWKTILNWSEIPNLGPIHKLSDEDFEKFYFMPGIVTETINRIIHSIDKDYGFNNKVIIGEPGSGKTTFVYFLKKILATKHSNLNNYHIEIVHINRLINATFHERLIETRTLVLLRRFFTVNGLGEIFTSLTEDEEISKEKINKIEDYIVENKNNFKKKMIVIIDDIDESPEELVEKSVRYFYSLLECEQITKWLIARQTTLNNYKIDFLEFIETKFPQSMRFPRIELHGILNKRIETLNPHGINPYIEELCSMIVSIFENDLRQSVTNSLAFLEHTFPPETSKNNPQFAGQYLITNFTKVMNAIGVFPNSYIDSTSHLVPIEKDVFLILATHNRIFSGFLPKLNAHYREHYTTRYKGKYSGESYLININMDHINESIFYLINHRLIKKHERIEGFYTISSRGESFIKFVMEKLYTDRCEIECDKSGRKKHPMFWDLARIAPRFDPTT